MASTLLTNDSPEKEYRFESERQKAKFKGLHAKAPKYTEKTRGKASKKFLPQKDPNLDVDPEFRFYYELQFGKETFDKFVAACADPLP